MEAPNGMVVQKGYQGRYFGKHIFRDMTAARAWIVYRIKTMKEERTNKNEIC